MTDTSDIKATMARVESGVQHLSEKVDLMHGLVVQRLDDQHGRLNNHSQRVKSLEESRARLKGYTGGLAGVGAVIAAVVAWIKGT